MDGETDRMATTCTFMLALHCKILLLKAQLVVYVILPAVFCRANIYLEGGVLFITTRILVVDMLVERIPIHLVSGILVYKAHQYVPLLFILCLYCFGILLYFYGMQVWFGLVRFNVPLVT